MKFLLVIVAAALAALTSGSALRVNRALAHEEQEVLDADSEFGPVPPGQPGQPGGPPQLPGTTVKQAAAAVSPCGAMDKIGAACKKDRDTCSPDGGKSGLGGEARADGTSRAARTSGTTGESRAGARS